MRRPLGPLHAVAAVRELDRRAIAAGIPARELMRRAGRAASAALLERYPAAAPVLVLAGPGNNGGDGYDLARELLAHGRQARVLAPLGPPRSAEAESARAEYLAAGGELLEAAAADELPPAALYADALFGVGFDRPPEGAAASWLQRLARASAPVVALDVPSGVDADRGTVPGPAARAALTVCFIAAKRGLFTGAALDHAGEVWLDDLGLPEALLAAVAPAAELLRHTALAAALPPRPRDCHKGDFGHVLVIAGARGFGGAARLAGEGALRAGAGWVSVATAAEHVPALLAGRPELMARGFEALDDLWPKATVIAVGPGLGTGSEARALLARALAFRGPRVLDADALNLLAERPQPLGAATVITPHPGEAGRLLGIPARAVQADRFAAARALAERLGCTVVLKGAGTLVDDGASCAVIGHGHPAMAGPGMGDVLAGVIAGLLAQGLAPAAAARLGALAHAVAGERRAPGPGGRGLLAGDLLAELPALLSS